MGGGDGWGRTGKRGIVRGLCKAMMPVMAPLARRSAVSMRSLGGLIGRIVSNKLRYLCPYKAANRVVCLAMRREGRITRMAIGRTTKEIPMFMRMNT